MKTTIASPALAGYAKPLRCISKDERISATHVSLFTGLFIHWQRSGFASPFAVTRKTLMAYSKIASITTYHKCIKELDTYCYISYQPSYHPKLGSQVYWPEDWQILRS
jgi:hypothetical protein